MAILLYQSRIVGFTGGSDQGMCHRAVHFGNQGDAQKEGDGDIEAGEADVAKHVI